MENQTSLHSLGVAVALNMLPPRPSSGIPGERPGLRSSELINCVCVCVCVCLFLFLSLFLYPSVSVFFFLCRCLFVFLSFYPNLFSCTNSPNLILTQTLNNNKSWPSLQHSLHHLNCTNRWAWPQCAWEAERYEGLPLSSSFRLCASTSWYVQYLRYYISFIYWTGNVLHKFHRFSRF